LSFYEKGLQDKKPVVPTAPTVNKNVWGADRYTANK
jgi:hypothetical protein